MNRVSILTAPWADPSGVIAAFRDDPWRLALLSDGMGERGRWSYLAGAPDAVLTVAGGGSGDAFGALAGLLGRTDLGMDPAGPPFQGGVAGLAAYELGDRVERLGLARHIDWPDLACARYSNLLAFDHAERRVLAIGRGADAAEAEGRARLARGWLDAAPPAAFQGAMARNIVTRPGQDYERSVADVVARIAAGEIFQANVARAWTGQLAHGAHPADLALRLFGASPAPFAAWMRLPGRALVSNSPERFLSVRRTKAGLLAETRPIKGTRPRGADAAEDRRLAGELHASAKDRAENLMIVDLMRNDLARVCRPGGVKVPDLWRIESFANVHHLVSTVTGELAEGRSAIDLLRAAFPPGSITGAPKVQAMKVIAELEPPRGPFFGSLFWAGFDGAFDSSVLIRTAAFVEEAAGWSVEARAGAGLVADSQPCEERRETETKISALLKALGAAR